MSSSCCPKRLFSCLWSTRYEGGKNSFSFVYELRQRTKCPDTDSTTPSSDHTESHYRTRTVTHANQLIKVAWIKNINNRKYGRWCKPIKIPNRDWNIHSLPSVNFLILSDVVAVGTTAACLVYTPLFFFYTYLYVEDKNTPRLCHIGTPSIFLLMRRNLSIFQLKESFKFSLLQ